MHHCVSVCGFVCATSWQLRPQLPCVAQLWSPGADFADSKKEKRTNINTAFPSLPFSWDQQQTSCCTKKEADLPPETDCVTLQIKVAFWCDLETSEVI